MTEYETKEEFKARLWREHQAARQDKDPVRTEATLAADRSIDKIFEGMWETELAERKAVESVEHLCGLAKAMADGSFASDVHSDAPLSLEDALCLPELGGHMAANPAFSRRSSYFTVPKLRQAVASGTLPKMKIGKNLFLTKRAVQEYMSSCLARSSRPISSSATNAGTGRPAASPTNPSTSSRTESAKRAQAAAQEILRARKKS